MHNVPYLCLTYLKYVERKIWKRDKKLIKYTENFIAEQSWL